MLKQAARLGQLHALYHAKLAYGISDFGRDAVMSVGDLAKGTGMGLGHGAAAFSQTYRSNLNRGVDPITSLLPATASGLMGAAKGFYQHGGLGGAFRVGMGAAAAIGLKKLYDNYRETHPEPEAHPDPGNPDYNQFARQGVY